MIDKDIDRLKELQSTIYEGGDYIYLNKNDKQALGNVLSEFQGLRDFSTETVRRNAELQEELEIYIKMAEKLAEDKIIPKCKNCSDEDTHECTECALEWARKEIEKDVVREYIYLVSYHHSKGYGTITLNLKRKINSIEHILEIHKYIEDKNKFENVGIISYQLICEKMARNEVENEQKNT